MTTPSLIDFPDTYDHAEVEARIAHLWEEARLYDYDPESTKPVYSIDTPPPYVSAAHLHVGHAMSYAQAEFVVRYRRMRGHSIF
jgi:valyl-tRNA synthetase